jgi:ATP-dependent RNA helicase RhlE
MIFPLYAVHNFSRSRDAPFFAGGFSPETLSQKNLPFVRLRGENGDAPRMRAACHVAWHGRAFVAQRDSIVLTEVTFTGLGLAGPLLKALEAENYTHPTPIQAQAIPLLLEGRDLFGLAQTGTGKTAAFTLPLLQRLNKDQKQPGRNGVRALILAPTRELAVQIGDSIRAYARFCSLRHTVITGGVPQHRQVKAMNRGVDILVATPGRLLDLVNQRHVDLHSAETFILDEGDRMFDMGFIRDIRKIVAMLPRERHTMLFSATMPREIEKLAREILVDPAKVEVTPKVITVDRIEQHVFHVQGSRKRDLLHELMADPALSRVIVFTRTKHGANRLANQLVKSGVNADAIHGNKSQGARQRALNDFKDNRSRVLVATDIASRGIDVDDVSHVINFDLPMEAESYVHRIGRTARAGAGGIAISFCDPSERKYLRDIERLLKRPIDTAENPLGAANDSEPRERREHGEDRDQPRRKPHRGQPAGKKFRARKPKNKKAGGWDPKRQEGSSQEPRRQDGDEKPKRRPEGENREQRPQDGAKQHKRPTKPGGGNKPFRRNRNRRDAA